MTLVLAWLGAAALWLVVMARIWSWRCWRCRRRIWWHDSCRKCAEDVIVRWMERR